VPLPSLSAKYGSAASSRGAVRSNLAFHPVIVHNQVLIADHRSVTSYHLLTGRKLFRFDLKGAGLYDPGPGLDRMSRLPRLTLTVSGDRVYARLGAQRLTSRPAKSYLVCLDLSKPERDKKRLLWQVESKMEDGSAAFLEGAPLVHDGRVYVAMSQMAGERVTTSIVCFDERGRRRWSREVCDCPEFEAGAGRDRQIRLSQPEFDLTRAEIEEGVSGRDRQHLLTLAGGQIVYCSQAGAIVAVDRWTGHPTWAVRYPSRGALTAQQQPSPRDLAPAAYADGYVYAAPLDSDRIFCIDSVAGRVCWEVEGIEVGHILGVTKGCLLVTTPTELASIRTVNGEIQWRQPTNGPNLGRGLIAGNLIWPSLIELSGERAAFDSSRLHTLPIGNWAFGQGCLAIAGVSESGASELVVYVPASRLRSLPPPQLGP
jgi:hypothetical protein